MNNAQQRFIDWADGMCRKYGVSVEIDFVTMTVDFKTDDGDKIIALAEEMEKLDRRCCEKKE